MTRKFLTALTLLLLIFLTPASVLAQEYSFSVPQETVNLYWNADGTLSLEYLWVFENQPGAHPIDFVDVGMPNDNFEIIQVTAEVNQQSVPVSRSEYQGSGSGFAVVLGEQAIQPGQRGSVHVFVPAIRGVLYPDSQDNQYASAVFVPTWFGSQYVSGNTDLTVIFHLPPGVKAEEPRWHSAPAGFPNQPQTGIDDLGRITYTWRNPQASVAEQYQFGASFPRSYVPTESIVTKPPIDLDAVIAFLCIGFFVTTGLGLPILAIRAEVRRKQEYFPPKIAIEGHGIKRGLTAVEAAVLMEQPPDKIMTMILFGAIKKGAAQVIRRDPLEIRLSEPLPAVLRDYEIRFLQAFHQKDSRQRRKALEEMFIQLVRSVSEKMKGFSRRETIEYYKQIMERAWQQVAAADTPEVKGQLLEQNLEWTMLDKDYDDRSRRVFTGPILAPTWWERYDPTYQPRPTTTSGPIQPTPASQPSRALPGAEFAASVVGGVQTFSQKVIGNVTNFTSRVTKVTNPPPPPSRSTYHGGGGRGCACACACAGCACACAGGGR
ncbi:MAG: hypothetical protein ACP5QU_08865 [Anaerolineae bacterium]